MQEMTLLPGRDQPAIRTFSNDEKEEQDDWITWNKTRDKQRKQGIHDN